MRFSKSIYVLITVITVITITVHDSDANCKHDLFI